jgi:hypothetical protein
MKSTLRFYVNYKAQPMETNLKQFENQFTGIAPTQSEIRGLTEALTDAVLQGNSNPLSVYLIIKALRKSIEDAEKIIAPIAVDESFNYNANEKIVVNSCELRRMESGVRFDYSECGDPILAELYAQNAELKKKISDREELLKKIKENLVTIDVRTGEVIEIKPPVKRSTTTLHVTYPK